MKDRIKQFIEYKGISAGELAIVLDVQRSNISHILNGRNKPGAVFIEKLLLKFPDLNARWLLTGTGNMSEGQSENNSDVNPTLFDTNKEKEETVVTSPVSSPPIESLPITKSKVISEEVEKIILVYKDGTFSQLNPRV